MPSMAEVSTHPEYEKTFPEWQRARDVLAGEDAVKAACEKYLPRLDSQSDDEYAAYKARASFFGATARTVEEYLDLIFRRAPVFALGTSEQVKDFVRDCDLWGTEFVRYARRVVREVLSVGRGGSLVFANEAGRPVVSFWKAEEIVDWSVQRLNDRMCLSHVVLERGGKRTALRMVDGGCWSESLEKREDGEWVVVEKLPVQRGNDALPFVPFVFHGPRHSGPEVQRLPLADIIAANLDHYRLDADYKHGLHFAALPTAWVSGFDKAAPLRIGSSAAWVSEVPGASAGFLEFSGAGLAHLEKAIEKVERRMALLGARMLEGAAPGEGAGSGAADLCGLGSIVASLNQSLSRVLQIADWWVLPDGHREGLPPQGTVSFAMNTDLGARALSGDEITAVVAAWRSGAISRDTMLERLKRGEVLPDGRTVAQERALIHGKAVS
jgi:hypothetical protein